MMTSLSILRSEQVFRLEDAVSNPDRRACYATEAEFPHLPTEGLLRTAISVGPLPELTIGGEIKTARPANDAENAVKVYQFLGRLSRTQAGDVRLWSTLCHREFWKYAVTRWPVEGQAQEKQSNFIREHWFLKGGLRALRRNAIAQLWWAAHLTVAPWERDAQLGCFKTTDRFRFTRLLLSQQQYFVDFMERNYGSHHRLRICLLDALSSVEVSNKGKLAKAVTKMLQLRLKHQHLDALSVDELRPVLAKLVEDSREKVARDRVRAQESMKLETGEEGEVKKPTKKASRAKRKRTRKKRKKPRRRK